MMKRTPLYERHVALRSKLVDFAGWEMPIQYSGVVDEYRHVREAAGLFDVSHMGRVRVSGSGALAFLQRVTTNNVAAIPILGSQYGMVCNPSGGIKDDIFVYRVKADEFLLCVNASNRAKIVAWLHEQHTAADTCAIHDESEALAQLALQGPSSAKILDTLGLTDIMALKPRTVLPAMLHGVTCLISRTGYTGEPGWELYVPARIATRVWDDLMTAGAAVNLKAAGLGSRDLLRLEMAYLLYGNDISEETTPLEANAGWVVDFNKGDFIGRARLDEQRSQGVERRLVAFELLEKAVPRHGFAAHACGTSAAARKPIGEVTSGNLSPLLQKGIGLAYVGAAHAALGTRIEIEIRDKMIPAVIVQPPFYRRPKAAR